MAIRVRWRPVDEPALRPAADFSDREAPPGLAAEPARNTGENARAVRARIATSACGWPRPPTAAEFHDALRADRPTNRQFAIIALWAQEAGPREMLLAWVQRAYSWRTLVEALHRNGLARRGKLNAYLNWFAECPSELPGAKQRTRRRLPARVASPAPATLDSRLSNLIE